MTVNNLYSNTVCSDFPDVFRALLMNDSREIILVSHVMRKPVFPYANNKGADQPAHPRSLISAFVIRCLDSIIPLNSIFKLSSL